MLTRADEGYPILYVNPAFTELTGYSFDDVAGKDPGILQGPKTDQKLLGELRKKLESGEKFHGKTVNYCKDGSEFIMEWKIFPIIDSEKRTTQQPRNPGKRDARRTDRDVRRCFPDPGRP